MATLTRPLLPPDDTTPTPPDDTTPTPPDNTTPTPPDDTTPNDGMVAWAGVIDQVLQMIAQANEHEMETGESPAANADGFQDTGEPPAASGDGFEDTGDVPAAAGRVRRADISRAPSRARREPSGAPEHALPEISGEAEPVGQAGPEGAEQAGEAEEPANPDSTTSGPGKQAENLDPAWQSAIDSNSALRTASGMVYKNTPTAIDIPLVSVTPPKYYGTLTYHPNDGSATYTDPLGRTSTTMSGSKGVKIDSPEGEITITNHSPLFRIQTPGGSSSYDARSGSISIATTSGESVFGRFRIEGSTSSD